MASENKRVEIRVPDAMLEKIDKYKDDNGIITRAAAIMDLLRKALDNK